ncbi:MAG: C-GCAxxG-C-C family protein [Deltaproteobacteria bacterium]|nr:C-GCAxxG-C-C family protein [Deltaproteobacteria bacterium]
MEDKRLDKVFDSAKDNELNCTGCAQSTVAAVMDVLGIKDESAFRAASGLSMGVGLTGDGTCGALTGGAIAIGLLFGRTSKEFEDPGAAMRAYDLVRLLYDDFRARYGTARCNDIQVKLMGRFYDMDKDEDYEAALADGMRDHCSVLVGNAARKTLEIILNAKAEDEAQT